MSRPTPDQIHEIERGALSIAFLSGSEILTKHGLKARHFSEVNGAIWRVLDVASKSSPTGSPEPLHVSQLLAEGEAVGICAGASGAAFADLLQGTGDPSNALWYSDQIQAGWRQRQRLRLTSDLLRIESGESDGDTGEIIRQISELAAPPKPNANPLAPLATSFSDLCGSPLPPRQRLLGQWLYAGDLGALIAERGSGKSWFVSMIARALAMGEPLGDWEAPDSPLRVGIYDSEMALEDLHQRACAVGLADAGDRVTLLHYSSILAQRGRPLNLANHEDQHDLVQWAKGAKLDVLFLDNLTTSISGVEENSNDGFRDQVQPLLLAARAAGITLILVGHLGRNGKWRGASGKEDLLDFTLKLTRDEDGTDGVLKVKTGFDKFRRSRDGNLPLLWTLDAPSGGRASMSSAPFKGLDAMIALIEQGITKPGELAEELLVSPGTISKWGKKGIDSGRLKKNGRSEWVLNT